MSFIPPKHNSLKSIDRLSWKNLYKLVLMHGLLSLTMLSTQLYFSKSVELTQEGRLPFLLLLLLLFYHGNAFLFNHLVVFSPLHSLFCNFSLFLSNPTLLHPPLRFHRTGIHPNSTGIHHLQTHRLQRRLLHRRHCNSRPKLVSFRIFKVPVVSNPQPVCDKNQGRVQG